MRLLRPIMLPHAAFLLAAPGSIVTFDAADPIRWEGWGTSLAWMGNAFGDRADIADLLFGAKSVSVVGHDLPGLAMNIVRYNAGACGPGMVEGRTMALSSSIQPFRQIPGLWVDPAAGSAGWDWSRDRKQVTMLQNAARRGADRFELFANAPMWWMTLNGNPSGGATGTTDNLRPDRYTHFARYLATIAREATPRWGIRFTSVEPFNEPASDYWSATGRQEGCHFSHAAQAKFIAVLRRELDGQGLRELPIAASDETAYDQALGTWSAFEDATRARIGQVNAHGYPTQPGSREAFAAAVAHRPRWSAEYGDGDASGITMAREIIADLRVFRPSAWCYWQPLDWAGWGLLDSDLPAARVNRVNPKYHVFAQFSRHIRPGMALLKTSDPHTVGAYDSVGKRLIVVTLATGAAESRTLDLSAFPSATGSIRRWVTAPGAQIGYRREPDEPRTGDSVTIHLPARSVTTLEIPCERPK